MRRGAVLSLLLLLTACVTNPLTGRSQLILISKQEELKLGRHGYQQILGEAKLSPYPEEVDPVRRVSERIARAAEAYMREKGVRMRFEWEFNVVKKDKTPNAFCLPGGKIGVYTGIFPACYDENGLAAVVGHEVAHALGRHGAERVSQGMLQQLGATVLTAALHEEGKKAVSRALTAYGVVTQLGVMLPYSRSHETEADRIGLLLAARAGYDPRAGIRVWQRMERLHPGRTPEFLSTHPGHDTRISNMRRWMPELMKIHRGSKKAPVKKLVIRRGAQPPPPGRGTVRAAGFEPFRSGKGEAGLRFAFAFDRDTYVKKILVEGPGGIHVPIKAEATLLSRDRRIVTIRRTSPAAPPLPAGRYTLRFTGAFSGRPFERRIAYSVR